jgi:phospholipid/cholesterol/gamma-HCH transport system ATP-binding protein
MDIRTEPAHHAPVYQRGQHVSSAAGTETILRFDRVTLFFDEDVHALDNVSFELRRGQTRILFGAAGSGKSVLLKCALGLLRPQSGHIELFGHDVTQLEENELFEIRAKAGILFQESALFDSLTVRDNVAYPLLNQRAAGTGKQPKPNAEEVENRVREPLRFVELEETLDKFPSALSGGMRRRVGIARAAVTEPPLILYDSPTAGLDPITANTIIALIVKARDTRNTTSMLVTHRYQDGHMMANYRWNSQRGEVEPAGSDSPLHESTIFMVFREGKLVFEGTQQELQEATDPYVTKFKSSIVRRTD